MNYAHDWHRIQDECEAIRAEREAVLAEVHKNDDAYPIRRKQARDAGKKIAKDVADLVVLNGGAGVARDALERLCNANGVDYPESKFGPACEVARLTSGDWWGRKLRVSDWRTFEMRKIRTAQVGIKRDAGGAAVTENYCSDEIARAHHWHKAAIAQVLDNLYAVRLDGGALLTLHEAAQTSKSNPAIRRVAMIRQAKGMAEMSTERAGWTWAFFTVTCPSRFHRTASKGKGGDLTRYPNPKWDGSSPREAQEHLVSVFSRWRSKLARAGIDYMYCRVVEPHVDGCPHWHGIVWTHRDKLATVGQYLREYALQVDGKERGAWKHRMNWKKYRPWAAQNVEGETDKAREVNAAIGYLIAYIGKNIDGKRGDEKSLGTTRTRDGQELAGDATDNAVRVVAWASLWGIRQFDFGGAPAIGPYDELRRLRTSPGNMLEPAWAAADRGDFAAYAKEAAQLGIDLIIKTSRDRLEEVAEEAGIDPTEPSAELVAAALASDVFNRWGEPSRRWVLGVRGKTSPDAEGFVFEAEANTRPHKWVTAAVDRVRAIADEIGSAGRRLLDMLKEKLTAKQEADDARAFAFAFAIGARREAARLGPGSITVRDSGQLSRGGGGPPAYDDEPDGYFINAFGFEQATF